MLGGRKGGAGGGAGRPGDLLRQKARNIMLMARMSSVMQDLATQTQERQAQSVELLQRYLPKLVTKRMLHDDNAALNQTMHPEQHCGQCTVLFADLSGFSRTAETMAAEQGTGTTSAGSSGNSVENPEHSGTHASPVPTGSDRDVSAAGGQKTRRAPLTRAGSLREASALASAGGASGAGGTRTNAAERLREHIQMFFDKVTIPEAMTFQPAVAAECTRCEFHAAFSSLIASRSRTAL